MLSQILVLIASFYWSVFGTEGVFMEHVYLSREAGVNKWYSL